MDDTLKKGAPKPKAKAGKGSSRKSAAAAPAARPKARSGSTKQATEERDKAPRKEPARRKGKVAAAPAAETKPAVKQPRAMAKPKKAKPAPVETLAEMPLAPVELLPAESHGEGLAADVTIHPVEPHVPSVHPHDEGLEFGLSPVDLAPDARVREEAGLGWFIRILALSSVLLVLFNSFAIDKWAREQPVTKLNSPVLIAAHQLNAEMKRFHLDAPLEGMRSIWHGIRDARWPGSPSSREKAVKENPPAK